MRAFLVSLLLFWLVPDSAGAKSDNTPSEVEVRAVAGQPRHVTVTVPGGLVIAPGARLLLVVDGAPVTWADLVEIREDEAMFKIAAAEGLCGGSMRLRGWLMPLHLTAALLDRWPEEGTLQAEVDSLGPGEQSIWVRAGANEGVGVGDSWWLRVGGQPAARSDVRFVGPDVCFCAVVPLASDPSVRVGTRVALWPAPGERRTGRATSAVSFIEERAGSTVVWIAAPPGVICPPEPHVDFLHDGRYVGHGLVERRDARFWYARFVPVVPDAAGARTASQPTVLRAEPSSAPTTARAWALGEGLLRVGDEVTVRTQADIDERRFVARVFEIASAGALVNAGEADGLTTGQKVMAYRNGSAVGRVAVRAVQRSYAVVGPAEEKGDVRLELRVGDELRFNPLLPPPTVVGVIVSVTDDTLIAVRPTVAAPLLGTPLAVRASDRTIGVAVLVTADDRSAAGFVLPCSIIRSPAAGMQLVHQAGQPAEGCER